MHYKAKNEPWLEMCMNLGSLVTTLHAHKFDFGQFERSLNSNYTDNTYMNAN